MRVKAVVGAVLGGLLLLLQPLLVAGVAVADTKSADELYSQAVQAKKSGRYALALEKYAAARAQLEPGDTMRAVRVFWGIGTTYERMRDCPNAITTWEEYIRFASGKPGETGGIKNAKQKIDVCKRILDMRP